MSRRPSRTEHLTRALACEARAVEIDQELAELPAAAGRAREVLSGTASLLRENAATHRRIATQLEAWS